MLLAITLGVILALFIMVVMWCRAAMRASARRAEAAAKRKLDAQTWAKLKASRRQAQNDFLDRQSEAAEASKPILSKPMPKRSALRVDGGLTLAKPASAARVRRTSTLNDDVSSHYSPPSYSPPSYDYGSSYSSGSDSYSGGGSCSSDSGGGGGGGGGGCD